MSLIAQIADEAGVSVEGVVRVLTRQTVGEDVRERVLDAFGGLPPADQELVRRAATLTRPLVEGPPFELHDPEPVEDGSADDAAVLTVELGDRAQAAAIGPARPAVPDAPVEAELAAAVRELSRAMSALGESVRDLRRDGDAERAARIEDFSLLVDLITTGWRTVDRRLGRLERLAERSTQPG